jgi:hypothetical protein
MAESLMEFTVSDSAGPPAGIYKATFEGVTKTNHPEYGDGARFDWKVTEGEHKGRIASRTGKPVPSAKNCTGRLMAGLLGRAIAPGERVSLAALVGKTFTIVVAAAPNGTATRVESCIPS